MATRDTDEQDRIVRQGTAAWKRLKKDKSWTDWLAVGEALQVGREHAMYQAGTNRPEGKGYSQAFSRWLTSNQLDDMDKSDRAKLFKVMENLPAIEAWRAKLTLAERLKLNHPATVLRNWQKEDAEEETETETPEPPPPRQSKSAAEELYERLQAAEDWIEKLEKDIEQLQARIRELEAENTELRLRLGEEVALDAAKTGDDAGHLTSDAENGKPDPELQRLVDQKVDDVLTNAGVEGNGKES